jgi:hypothetical protein
MQLDIEFEGRVWALDTENLTITQAFVIKDATKDEVFKAGRPIQPWLMGTASGDPGCLRGMYWLMLQQDGQQRAIGGLEFAAAKFHSAYMAASAFQNASAAQLRELVAAQEQEMAPILAALKRAEEREAEEEAERQAEQARKAALAALPTVAPSPEPDSPTATTPKRHASVRATPRG